MDVGEHTSTSVMSRKMTDCQLKLDSTTNQSSHHELSARCNHGSLLQTQHLCVALTLALFITIGACTSKLYVHPAYADSEQELAAEVYFIRERHWAGSAMATLVRLNEENLLRLRSGTYTAVRLKPGSYMVDVAVSTWQAPPSNSGMSWEEGSLAITVEPGQKYFVLLRFTSTHQNQLLFYPDLITEEKANGLIAEYEHASDLLQERSDPK